jgi:hypothetical protein
MLTHEQKAKWLARLRDPSSKQVFGLFRAFDGGCCALGWLGDVMGQHASYVIPNLSVATQINITRMNDEEKKSLPEIADWIEANVPCSDP